MNAYLEPIREKPTSALGRAIAGFRRREGRPPAWAAAGPGITLDTKTLTRLGLQKQTLPVREGHVLVGTGTIESKEAVSPPA